MSREGSEDDHRVCYPIVNYLDIHLLTFHERQQINVTALKERHGILRSSQPPPGYFPLLRHVIIQMFIQNL